MGPGNERGCYKSSAIYGIPPFVIIIIEIMSTNDHYNINPPGTDRFKVKNMRSAVHMDDGAGLPTSVYEKNLYVLLCVCMCLSMLFHLYFILIIYLFKSITCQDL